MIFKRGWFGPKRIGWGASPASWQGWAATGVFIVSLFLTSSVFREESWVWIAMAGLVAAFVAVVLLTYDKNARTHV